MKADDGFSMTDWLKSLQGRPVNFIQEPEKGRLSLLIRMVQDFAHQDMRLQEVLDERDALREKLRLMEERRKEEVEELLFENSRLENQRDEAWKRAAHWEKRWVAMQSLYEEQQEEYPNG